MEDVIDLCSNDGAGPPPMPREIFIPRSDDNSVISISSSEDDDGCSPTGGGGRPRARSLNKRQNEAVGSEGNKVLPSPTAAQSSDASSSSSSIIIDGSTSVPRSSAKRKGDVIRSNANGASASSAKRSGGATDGRGSDGQEVDECIVIDADSINREVGAMLVQELRNCTDDSASEHVSDNSGCGKSNGASKNSRSAVDADDQQEGDRTTPTRQRKVGKCNSAATVAKPSCAAANANTSRKGAAKRARRGADGFGLKEGEEIVWATQKQGGRLHQAIIVHPQPDLPSPGHAGRVYIEWVPSNNVFEWIPLCNIIRNEEASTSGSAKYPKRERKKTARMCDEIAASSKLACEREGIFTLGGKEKAKVKRELACKREGTITLAGKEKKKAKLKRELACEREGTFTLGGLNKKQSKRATCYTNLALANKQKGGARAQLLLAGEFEENEWWEKIPNEITFHFKDDESMISEVTFGSQHQDSSVELDLTGETGESSQGDVSGMNDSARVVTPLPQCCHICASRRHHFDQMNKLLEESKASQVDQVGFVIKFQVLIKGLEDDCWDGTDSIFFHTCQRNEAPNPIFTVAKLVQLFDIVCQSIPAMVASERSAASDANTKLLFDPCKKKNLSDCGIMIQVMRLVTFEIVNSREDFVAPENPHDLDQLVGVTFGLHLLESMARNAYTEFNAKHQSADSQLPLESYTKCIRKNCQVERQHFVRCRVCGIRIHKKCLQANECTGDNLIDKCPTCKASAMLVQAAKTGKLSDIYSLVVEQGGSPFRGVMSDTGGHESALHAAVRSNNYDLASMLLYGSYLILNCDKELAEWNIPELCGPFKCGIDMTKGNLLARPPVETLMLLCGRGARSTMDDIKTALQIRQNIKLVNKGLELSQANVQRELKSDIAGGLELHGTAVAFASANDVPSFTYIARSVETKSTAIRWFDCRINGGKRRLMPFSGGCTLRSRKLLHRQQALPPSWKSYCNYLCESRTGPMKKCECQVAENGMHYGLEVFETPDGRGLGVRTAKGVIIQKDSIICHYSGEIITSKEASARDKKYEVSHAGSYILNMDEKGKYCLDATEVRSVAALINHACSESNCELYRALSNHLDTNFPFLGLRAKEDIPEGTELTFNYLKGSNHADKPEGLCSECGTTHCLCPQCKALAHKKS